MVDLVFNSITLYTVSSPRDKATVFSKREATFEIWPLAKRKT